MATLDPLLARMRADGVCSYGATREEWARTWEQRSLENPPALLMVNFFEWMRPDEAAQWVPPDYWSKKHRFVPFAHSGTGDLYAFYPKWNNAVVIAAHDLNETEVLAPHLEGFLHRKMLEALTFEPAGSVGDGELTPSQKKRALGANIATLRPYLRPEWSAELEEIAARKPKRWSIKLRFGEEKYLSRLDDKELKRRLKRVLKFEHLGEKFEHMKRS